MFSTQKFHQKTLEFANIAINIEYIFLTKAFFHHQLNTKEHFPENIIIGKQFLGKHFPWNMASVIPKT